MISAWLPYRSLDEAESHVGAIDDVSYAVFADAGMPLPDDPEQVAFIALPNAGGQQAWESLRDRPMPNLRVIQLGSAGYEHMLPVLPDGVMLCNAAGVHDAATSEMAVALALASGRRLDAYARNQREHRWAPEFGRSVADQRVLIFGYGRIGQAVERRLAAFEAASVTRVARHRRDDPVVHPVTELAALLPGADLVIITAPATPETTGVFDDAMLARLPDDALVVNVGRGPIVETAAIVRAAGRLRFALDVTDPEPLPGDHPLWEAPGVLIAPHVGGFSAAFQPRYDRLIREQLTKFAAGWPVENVVAGPKEER